MSRPREVGRTVAPRRLTCMKIDHPEAQAEGCDAWAWSEETHRRDMALRRPIDGRPPFIRGGVMIGETATLRRI